MPTSEKDVLTEILIKVARIEENTKSLDKVSEKADKAYSIGLSNKDDIQDIKSDLSETKANNRWAWGFIISLGVTIVGYFLTKFK